MLALAIVPVTLRLALLATHPMPSPDVYDEFSHLLAADTLRHLRFANPPHALPQFFETFFVLHASSTNGASNIASVSIMVGPPSVAKAGRARPRGAGAEIPVTCDFSGVGVGASCDVTVTMSVTEILRANKLVAVTSAKSRRPKKTRKVVTVGRVSMVIGAGRAQIVDVRLNGRGKRLLSARGKLPVSIVVSQTVGAATQVVSHQRLTLRSGSARHKKPR